MDPSESEREREPGGDVEDVVNNNGAVMELLDSAGDC